MEYNVLFVLSFMDGKCYRHHFTPEELEEIQDIGCDDSDLDDINVYIETTIADRYGLDISNCDWMLTTESCYELQTLKPVINGYNSYNAL